jgi:hypothetical protein
MEAVLIPVAEQGVPNKVGVNGDVHRKTSVEALNSMMMVKILLLGFWDVWGENTIWQWCFVKKRYLCQRVRLDMNHADVSINKKSGRPLRESRPKTATGSRYLKYNTLNGEKTSFRQ